MEVMEENTNFEAINSEIESSNDKLLFNEVNSVFDNHQLLNQNILYKNLIDDSLL